jgi:hypothetical protein
LAGNTLGRTRDAGRLEAQNMTQFDKTTLAIVYLGLLFGVPAVLAMVAAKLAWRGVSPIAQRLGRIGLLLCHPFIVFRNWKQSSVRG